MEYIVVGILATIGSIWIVNALHKAVTEFRNTINEDDERGKG